MPLLLLSQSPLADPEVWTALIGSLIAIGGLIAEGVRRRRTRRRARRENRRADRDDTP